MNKTLRDVRAAFPAEAGWAIRSWLTVDKDDRCVVQVTLCDIEDHVIASSFGGSSHDDVEQAEDSALERLAYVVFGVPCD